MKGVHPNKEFTELLLSGKHSECTDFILAYSKKLPIQELCENIIKKSMYEIGELWETNKISVATEHMAS